MKEEESWYRRSRARKSVQAGINTKQSTQPHRPLSSLLLVILLILLVGIAHQLPNRIFFTACGPSVLASCFDEGDATRFPWERVSPVL
jgi:hypothetical protein